MTFFPLHPKGGTASRVRCLLPALLCCFCLLPLHAQPAPEPATPSPEEPRRTYGVALTTEAQWHTRTGEVRWMNLLELEGSVRLWRGATAEAATLSTLSCGHDKEAVWQEHSCINAPSRGLRVAHLGIGQEWARPRLTTYVGLRGADEDYFNTPLAGLFTGASMGCLPTVNDNFCVNVYPLSALGLHVEWEATPALRLRSSLYNGKASDRLDEQLRFRPRADGLIYMGSAELSPQRYAAWPLPGTYVLGWNVGHHHRDPAFGRHTQWGFWLVAEQPVARMAASQLTVGLTLAQEYKQPEAAKSYYGAQIGWTDLGRMKAAVALSAARAFYREGHETNFELTASLPLVTRFSLQPSLHYYRTDGHSHFVPQLRLSFEL